MADKRWRFRGVRGGVLSACLRMVSPCVGRWPRRWQRHVGAVLGRMGFLLCRHQRETARRQLADRLQLAEPECGRVVSQLFSHLGRNLLEWCALPYLSTQRLDRCVRVHGLEHVDAALQAGHGGIIVCGHFGNWEWVAAYIALHGYPFTVVARRAREPALETWIHRSRSSTGVRVLDRDHAFRDLVRCLRGNELVGLVADLHTTDTEGVFVPFFGEHAYTSVGPAALAQLTGAPLLLTSMIRRGDAYDFVIEPVPLSACGDREYDLTENTRRWMEQLEGWIRQYPEQWMWMHDQWNQETRAKWTGRSSRLETRSRAQ